MTTASRVLSVVGGCFVAAGGAWIWMVPIPAALGLLGTGVLLCLLSDRVRCSHE
jgi:hypothetical protein